MINWIILGVKIVLLILFIILLFLFLLAFREGGS